MSTEPYADPQKEPFYTELRTLLEEICSSLCRFIHLEQNQLQPEQIHITQEIPLTTHPHDEPAFADIKVQLPDTLPYYLEIKHGYPPQRLITHLARKYGPKARPLEATTRIILVLDTHLYPDWEQLHTQLHACFQPGLKLEIWDEPHLLALISRYLDLEIDSFTPTNIIELKIALDEARGRYAFQKNWKSNYIQSSLLWHFGFWKLRHLRTHHKLNERTILPPGNYPNTIILRADLSNFSSYVRDTPDDQIVRQALTCFYSKARQLVLNTGGMLYQFIGDEVVALYGLPHPEDHHISHALHCARGLLDIGASISNKWQRQIDQIQPAKGVHIGMSMGDIQIVSMTPFGRAHLGGIGDALNMSARLVAYAKSGEIVVSNTYFQNLPDHERTHFHELEPLPVKNLGNIQAWKLAS